MSDRDSAIQAARAKLEEASFFLSKLREAESHPLLDEAEKGFDRSFLAFLSETRSAPYIISNLEKEIRGLKYENRECGAWEKKARQGWRADELELYEALTEIRNRKVHSGTGGANSTTEFVREWDVPMRPGKARARYLFVGPPGAEPPKIGVKRFSVKIGTRLVPAIACAGDYLALTRRMIDHYAGSSP